MECTSLMGIVKCIANTLIKNLKDATSRKRSANLAWFRNCLTSTLFAGTVQRVNGGEKKTSSYKLLPTINFHLQLSNYTMIYT